MSPKSIARNQAIISFHIDANSHREEISLAIWSRCHGEGNINIGGDELPKPGPLEIISEKSDNERGRERQIMAASQAIVGRGSPESSRESQQGRSQEGEQDGNIVDAAQGHINIVYTVQRNSWHATIDVGCTCTDLNVLATH